MKFENLYKKGLSHIKLSRDKSAWGLAIGDNEIKAVKVRSINGELLIEVIDRINYSTVNQGTTSIKSEQIKDAIVTFTKRNLINKSDKIIVSLSGKMVLSRFVSLPPMKKRRIVEAIKYELRKQIPFQPNEIVWDSHRFEDNTTRGKGTEVGIFATKKENIHDLLPSLAPIKMNLEAIQITPIAIYNLAKLSLDSDEDVFVVNVEKDNTDFIVVGKTKYWNRSIPISEVNIDLVREIQRSMGYYVSLSKGTKHENIFLMGEVFEDEQKVKFIEESLEGKVTFLNLLEKISISKDVDPSVLNKKTIQSFGTALGLAIQGLGLSKINTNLLPFEYIIERQVPRQRALAGAITILIFLSLLTQSLKDYISWRTLSKSLETINTTHNEVKKWERVYRNIGEKVKEEEKKLQILASIGTQGSFWIEAIRKVIDIMPEKVYLLSLESFRDLPYADKENTSKKEGESKEVLIMSIKGESYDPRMSFLKEMVRKPLENLKLFDQQAPAFRNVEFVQGSVHNVDSFIKKSDSEVFNIYQDIRPIAFEIRWIVNTIN
ncbi:MAG: type IV pilus biogenesis protein PilM [Candidatus Scalinduaceae bacterium]